MLSHFLFRNKGVDAISSSEASRGGALRLASWFVWCQACRHGGHAGHIFDWFYGGGGEGNALPPTIIECPVNGCFCRCAGLDSSVPQPCSASIQSRFSTTMPLLLPSQLSKTTSNVIVPPVARNASTQLANMRELAAASEDSSTSPSSSPPSPIILPMSTTPTEDAEFATDGDLPVKLIQTAPISAQKKP